MDRYIVRIPVFFGVTLVIIYLINVMTSAMLSNLPTLFLIVMACTLGASTVRSAHARWIKRSKEPQNKPIA